jgi:hypothetical protein
MGGPLSQPEKDFIFPLLKAVLQMFGTVSKFVDYSLVHPGRPARTRLVNPARSTSKGNPVNFKDVLSSQINGSPRHFPEWWVVEWVISVVMSKSTEDKRVEALNTLGWKWAEVRGQRPWGFDGAVPGECALIDPADAQDDETKYAVLRNATLPDLRYEVEVLKAEKAMLQSGRHYNLAEEVADLRARLALAEQAKNDAELRRAEAEDLVARVRQHNDELVRENVAVSHKFENLRSWWNWRRTSSPAPISGTLDAVFAAERTAVILAVSPHHPPVEALDPVADSSDEFAQQRYKHNAWRTPELENLANDSKVETMLMEIGQILAFGTPRVVDAQTPAHDESGMPFSSRGHTG